MVRIQERDRQIFLAIYEYGGVLTGFHLWQLFWPQAKEMQAVIKRMRKLYHAGYVMRPSAYHRRMQYVPRSNIFWLGWRGILEVASRLGVDFDEPKTINESSCRKLQKDLRDNGIYWLREPRWSPMKRHDLKVVDFRIAVEKELSEVRHLKAVTWLHEGMFRSDSDSIAYTYMDIKGKRHKEKKHIWPDWYFLIHNENRREQGKNYRARFFVEFETGSRDNPKFGKSKIAPALAYVSSSAYERRFDGKGGSWLIVTAGKRAMQNRMREAERIAGKRSNIFFFTTLHDLKSSGPLTDPIWHQIGAPSPTSLFQ